MTEEPKVKKGDKVRDKKNGQVATVFNVEPDGQLLHVKDGKGGFWKVHVDEVDMVESSKR